MKIHNKIASTIEAGDVRRTFGMYLADLPRSDICGPRSTIRASAGKESNDKTQDVRCKSIWRNATKKIVAVGSGAYASAVLSIVRFGKESNEFFISGESFERSYKLPRFVQQS